MQSETPRDDSQERADRSGGAGEPAAERSPRRFEKLSPETFKKLAAEVKEILEYQRANGLNVEPPADADVDD